MNENKVYYPHHQYQHTERKNWTHGQKGKRKIQGDSKPGLMELPARPKPCEAKDGLSIMFPASHSEEVWD